MKPNWYWPGRCWTGISPYGNPNVVPWSLAPWTARLWWRWRRIFTGPQTYRDPDGGREWRA